MEPGTEVVVDESLGKWIPCIDNTPEGIPRLFVNHSADFCLLVR